MASPHVCGLLAYLLSIHGTPTFSIRDVDASAAPLASSRLYTAAYALLPAVAQYFLPAPALVAGLAPVPKKPEDITPKQLKDALIRLSSKGVLIDLSSKTPNLLVFNNATTTPLRK